MLPPLINLDMLRIDDLVLPIGGAAFRFWFHHSHLPFVCAGEIKHRYGSRLPLNANFLDARQAADIQIPWWKSRSPRSRSPSLELSPPSSNPAYGGILF